MLRLSSSSFSGPQFTNRIPYLKKKMSSSSIDLHIIFFPFPSPGHIIPLVGMANIMSVRHGVRSTIVTTPGNAPLIQPSIDDNITLLTRPSPSSTSPENTTSLPTPELTSEFVRSLDALEGPFEHLIHHHNLNPDCVISDTLLPWTADVASRLRIPRIVFASSGCFPSTIMGLLRHVKPQDGVATDGQPFTLPGLPHPIQMTRSQLPKDLLLRGSLQTDYWMEFVDKIMNALPRNYGFVTNSFYAIEPDYVEMFKNFVSPKMVWSVGPVSLLNDRESSIPEDYCLSWLEKKKPSSVLYVCFGSLGQFTGAQFREMAVGLQACGCPFIWVIRNGGDESEWMPEGFETRVERGEKGLILRGWAPQTPILNHRAVGGFVTHCGWNSILEGVTAGVPMVTWPLLYDQFFNERLVVDVLRIGVAAGSEISSFSKEERTLVSGERLQKAVKELMGEGEEADERRRRAKKLSAMARDAVEEGGSSCNDMRDMIQELMNAKVVRAKN